MRLGGGHEKGSRGAEAVEREGVMDRRETIARITSLFGLADAT